MARVSFLYLDKIPDTNKIFMVEGTAFGESIEDNGFSGWMSWNSCSFSTRRLAQRHIADLNKFIKLNVKFGTATKIKCPIDPLFEETFNRFYVIHMINFDIHAIPFFK